MKKRTVVVMMAAVMAAGSLVGCGASDTAAVTETQENTADEEQEDTVEDATVGANVETVENAEELTAMDESQLNGATITFWHAMGGVNGEALDYLVNK